MAAEVFDHWRWCAKGLLGVTTFLVELGKSDIPCGDEARQAIEQAVLQMQQLLVRESVKSQAKE